MTFQKRQSYRNREQVSGCQDLWVRGGNRLQRGMRELFGEMEMFSGLWWWLRVYMHLSEFIE